MNVGASVLATTELSAIIGKYFVLPAVACTQAPTQRENR